MDGFFVCKLRKFSNKLPAQAVPVTTSASTDELVSEEPPQVHATGTSQRAKEARDMKPPKPYLAPRAPKQPPAEASPSAPQANGKKRRRAESGK